MPISSSLLAKALAAKSQKPTPLTVLLPSPSTQQLSDTIKELQKVVNALEVRLAKMEHTVVISDGSVLIIADKDVSVRAGRSMVLDSCSDLTLRASGPLKLMANANLEIQVAATLNISASMIAVSTAMMQVSGTVKCSTLIANSVVGSTYTPGAGNVW